MTHFTLIIRTNLTISDEDDRYSINDGLFDEH